MVSFRDLHPDDKDMILSWRNSEQVAPFMLRDDPISREEHHEWFENVLEGSSSGIFKVAESNGTAIGLASLTRIDLRHRSCEWGGYLAPDVPRGTGYGRALVYRSLVLAFETLNLNRVVVEVLVTNSAATRLYESVGFRKEGTLRERAQQRGGSIDTTIMAMLKDEWNEVRGTVLEAVASKKTFD
jgi:UDP-4-amino-4,6-dideoxy-N-acetyl-beta-L-altrosamine N-acetyltransferase